MKPCYTADQIRRGEQPLLAAQAQPDALMRQAAFAVSEVAESMLEGIVGKHHLQELKAAPKQKVLLLVGSGGNGGDALYAGANLLRKGYAVDARIFGSKPHERALEAFQAAGGHLNEDPLEILVWNISEHYALLIDGIVGIGGTGALREEPSWIIREASMMDVSILAIDVPSGVAADTGQTFPGPTNTLNADPDLPEDMPTCLPGHVSAAVTVTFGGLRYAHAVSEACGTVVLADIGLPNRNEIDGSQDASKTLGELLSQQAQTISPDEESKLSVPVSENWRVKYAQAVPDYRRVDQLSVANALRTDFQSTFRDLEPRFSDDKYSGGVVGIAAGSTQYPGAAVLCTTAAVRATSSAVHFFGGCRAEVVRALPSVVAHETIDNPRVNAWVVGPGRGTGPEAVDELEALLLADEPLVIDADAITVLAENQHLQGLVRERASREAITVLTPHAGEFSRLRAGLAGRPVEDTSHAPEPQRETTGIPDPDADPIHATEQMALALQCIVLLKGHRTVVAAPPLHSSTGVDFPGAVTVLDAGSSWAATPGSGDVLSGLIGAWLARGYLGLPHIGAVETAAVIHSKAAEIAARTPYGYAPTDALSIAEAIRFATAQTINMTRPLPEIR